MEITESLDDLQGKFVRNRAALKSDAGVCPTNSVRFPARFPLSQDRMRLLRSSVYCSASPGILAVMPREEIPVVGSP